MASNVHSGNGTAAGTPETKIPATAVEVSPEKEVKLIADRPTVTELTPAAETTVPQKKNRGWAGDCLFRVIVPVLKVESVIGRNGEVINKLCEETKAHISVLGGPVWHTDRIVLISGKEEIEPPLSPAMDAVIRVFKVVNGFPENESDGVTSIPFCSIRLLVPSMQATSLIGKQGSSINIVQENVGCSVRILLSDEVSTLFANSDDRVVDLNGEGLKVLQALEAVLKHLRMFLVDHTILPLSEKTVTQKMLIPVVDGLNFIGVERSNIANIGSRSGAMLTVEESRGLPNEITVEIKGTLSQVQTAKQLIQYMTGNDRDLFGRSKDQNGARFFPKGQPFMFGSSSSPIPTNTANKTLSFPAFGVTSSSSITTTATGSVTQFTNPITTTTTTTTTGTSSSFLGSKTVAATTPQSTAASSLCGTGMESSEEPKRNRVSWENINIIKTFLDACIHEITINGREGGSLKAVSWKKVGEKLKTRHNFFVDHKQMKNYFDGLKNKYRAWLVLKYKTNNKYDPSTNTFHLTDKEWEIEIMKNRRIGTLRNAPLPFPDLCALLFHGVLTGPSHRRKKHHHNVGGSPSGLVSQAAVPLVPPLPATETPKKEEMVEVPPELPQVQPVTSSSPPSFSFPTSSALVKLSTAGSSFSFANVGTFTALQSSLGLASSLKTASTTVTTETPQKERMVFRVVVPVLKAESITGRNGDLIEKMCQETKAHIHVLEGPVCDTDRIVLISGKEEIEASLSPAMDAAIRVFKLVNGFPEDESNGVASIPFCSIRLLLTSMQATSLIGNQGSLINKIQENTGCSVRILSSDKVSTSSANSDDRVVDLHGEALKVLQALEAVLGHLRRFLVDHSLLPLFEKTHNATTTQEKHQAVTWAEKSVVHTDTDIHPRRESLFLDCGPQKESQFSSSGLSFFGRDPLLSTKCPPGPGFGRTAGGVSSDRTTPSSPLLGLAFSSSSSSSTPFSTSSSTFSGSGLFGSTSSSSSSDSTSTFGTSTIFGVSILSTSTTTAVSLPFSSGLFGSSSSPTPNFMTATTTNTASKTLSFPAFGATPSSITTNATGSVPQFASPTTTGTSSSFFGFQTSSKTVAATTQQFTAASSLCGTESNKESKQNKVYWNVNIVKTFLDACIHEITINGWDGCNLTLKPMSWKKVGEMLKGRHNFSVDSKQMNNYFDGLKRKYIAWVSLRNKAGNKYDQSTNIFNLTDKEWKTELMKNKCIGTLRDAPLPFPDLCAQLFYGALSAGYFQTGVDHVLTGPACHPKKRHCKVAGGPSGEASPEVPTTETPQKEAMVEVQPELPQVQPATASVTIETKRTMSVFEEEILGVLKMIAEKMNKPEPPSKPTFEDCEKKLNELGWAKDDPLHEVAYAIFCEENDKYRELWMKLDPKRCANWVRMIGRSKNFL